MKLLVETTGSFELSVTETGDYIRFEGATVVTSCNFVTSRISKGEIKLIENLTDDATDEEYLKYVSECDGNFELANSAFLGSFGEQSSVVTETKHNPARKVK